MNMYRVGPNNLIAYETWTNEYMQPVVEFENALYGVGRTLDPSGSSVMIAGKFRPPEVPQRLSVDVAACLGRDVVLEERQDLRPRATYRWRKGSVFLTDGAKYSGVTSARLTIRGFGRSDDATYACVVSNWCGEESSSFVVRACIADFDCDGQVNQADVDAFAAAFGAGELVADVNGDGVVNGSDEQAFMAAWNVGRC